MVDGAGRHTGHGPWRLRHRLAVPMLSGPSCRLVAAPWSPPLGTCLAFLQCPLPRGRACSFPAGGEYGLCARRSRRDARAGTNREQRQRRGGGTALWTPLYRTLSLSLYTALHAPTPRSAPLCMQPPVCSVWVGLRERPDEAFERERTGLLAIVLYTIHGVTYDRHPQSGTRDLSLLCMCVCVYVCMW